MSNDSVIVLSGFLDINGQQHNNRSEIRLFSEIKVKFVVYKTSNKHFAVIYPIVDQLGDNHLCYLNLKSCTVDVRSDETTHDVYITTNTDFDCLQLVLKIATNNHNHKTLYSHIRPDNQEISGAFGPNFRKVLRKGIFRQTSLQRVDEVE